MSEVFEAMMVLSFGISWPISILKAYKSRTAKGRSVFFSGFIIFGYACGIVSKLVSGKITYVFIFYVINLLAVCIDLALFFRNSKLDKLRDTKSI